MLERLRRILQAAMGDLIEKAKDPELELARFVEEVELGLGEVRAEIEEAEARRRTIAEEAAEQHREAQAWMGRAERYAKQDEDDAAKDALARRHDALDEAANCEERLAEAELALATLRKDEASAERKLKEARLEQKRLSARLRRAEAEKRASLALGAGGRGEKAKGDVSDRIIQAQASGEARREVEGESVEAQFGELESPSLDEELAALKRRLKKK